MGQYALMREAKKWVDSEEYAQDIHGRFIARVNKDKELDEHRTFIEEAGYGFGERSFHWLWKMIVDTLPKEFSFLEIGVYKGQVPSLIRLLADRTDREAQIVGVTLLSRSSGGTERDTLFPEGDYRAHITDLHEHFGQEIPILVMGDSTHPTIQNAAATLGPYDVVYVDGCHEYDWVVQDLQFYGNLVKSGGYLVVDDSANHFKQPFGFFQGIEDVSRAVMTYIETDPQWEHLLAVVHNRVWRRV